MEFLAKYGNNFEVEFHIEGGVIPESGKKVSDGCIYIEVILCDTLTEQEMDEIRNSIMRKLTLPD